jgi:hypothetical protein
MSETITVYEIDMFAYYTGNSKEISIYDPIEKGWTDEVLPELSDGQFAVFVDREWVVTTQTQPIVVFRPDESPYVQSVTIQNTPVSGPSDEQTPPQVI